MCCRMRAVREGTVAVGNAAAGRVRHAFEDACNGRRAERGCNENGGARGRAGGFKAKVPQEATREPARKRTCWRMSKNGGAREGELADKKRRCHNRQHVSRWHVERRMRCDKMSQQPAGADEEGGSRMDARDGCATKGDARQRRRDKRQRDNQPANRGKWEEMHQRTRGGGALISSGYGGGRVERTRGGGVDTPTSLQTRDNHGDGEGEGDGDGDGKCCAAAITGLGERPPRSSRLRLWLHSRRRQWRPWSSRLRLRPRSRRTTVGCASLATGGGLIN
jgi:hypothetical protein